MSEFQINPPIEEKKAIPWVFQFVKGIGRNVISNKEDDKRSVQKYYSGIGLKFK